MYSMNQLKEGGDFIGDVCGRKYVADFTGVSDSTPPVSRQEKCYTHPVLRHRHKGLSVTFKQTILVLLLG